MRKKGGWFWLGIEILLIVVAFAICSFIIIVLPENVAKMVISVFALMAILYSDNSCITRKIRRKISKKSILYRGKRKNTDEITECYKTASYFALLVRFVTPLAGWLTLGLGILFPVLAVVRYLRHSDKIRFSSGDKKHLSTTATILLLPGMLFLLWGIDNHKYPIHFWILWIVLSLLILIPFFVHTTEYKKNDKVALGFCACILLYVFGAICTINFQYDYSEPTEYRAIVSDKYETSGKSTTYYVVVEHGDPTLENTFSVSMHEYLDTEIGERVTVRKKEGFLKFEWYSLDVQ